LGEGVATVERRLTPISRKLRRDATDVEGKLWQRLRSRQIEGVKFRRQFAIGRYVADFACIETRLVIELDGGQHADSALDIERTRFIEANGYTVIRFWNNDATENIEGVLEQIRHATLNARPR
jgi:very-short-patch-repair endonuclease